ncbi:hypothetical protein [Streptomyces sp. F001]|uniref:hypothetical protein n=1 Tax=Streptomyces sp. F001 TaxID=1510026 RepID=UPI0019D298B8|nr:hypothetical protein [Streptomyces sp. F001]
MHVRVVHLCTALAAIGVTAPGGGLAQYVVVPGDSVHLLPEGVSLEQEPWSNPWQWP